MSHDPITGSQVGRGAGRWSRLPGLLLLAALLGGCATKHDLQELRGEMVVLEQRQDSLFRQLEARQAATMDSLAGNRADLVKARGDIIRQLLAMQEQLYQIQELTGQSQRKLTEMRQQFEQRSDSLLRPEPQQPAAAGGEAAASLPPGADPEQIYAAGREQLERGNVRTARQAFQMILQSAPNHRLAPDAQFSLAETYVKEDPQRALREFERVQELYPNSARAPAALYRAGVVARDQGQVAKAREYFQRVVRGYPRSDEAKAASEALGKLRS